MAAKSLELLHMQSDTGMLDVGRHPRTRTREYVASPAAKWSLFEAERNHVTDVLAAGRSLRHGG